MRPMSQKRKRIPTMMLSGWGSNGWLNLRRKSAVVVEKIAPTLTWRSNDGSRRVKGRLSNGFKRWMLSMDHRQLSRHSSSNMAITLRRSLQEPKKAPQLHLLQSLSRRNCLSFRDAWWVKRVRQPSDMRLHRALSWPKTKNVAVRSIMAREYASLKLWTTERKAAL